MSKERKDQDQPCAISIAYTPDKTIIKLFSPLQSEKKAKKTVKRFMEETGASRIYIEEANQELPFLVWKAEWDYEKTNHRPHISIAAFSKN